MKLICIVLNCAMAVHIYDFFQTIPKRKQISDVQFIKIYLKKKYVIIALNENIILIYCISHAKTLSVIGKGTCLFTIMPENSLFVLFSRKTQYLLCMTKLSNLIWKRLETCYLCYTWLHHDHAPWQTLHLEVFENSTALVKTLWCVRLILIFTLQWEGEAGYRVDDNFLELWNIPSKAQKITVHSLPIIGPDFIKILSWNQTSWNIFHLVG